MSYSIVKNPMEVSPVYNELVWAFDSSNKTKKGFNFMVDLYYVDENNDYNVLSRLKIPVNPNGYGVVDFHKHLEALIGSDFDPDNGVWTKSDKSYLKYSFDLYEEFELSWNFYDNYFDSASGDLAFVSLDPIPFTIGDEISIEQDSPYTYPQYNGVATYVDSDTFSDINGTNYVLVTDKSWIDSTGTESGTIKYSNFRKDISTLDEGIGPAYTFNAVWGYLAFIDYDTADFVAGLGSPGKFLTNVPNNYEVKDDSTMFLNIMTKTNETFDYLEIRTNNGIYRYDNPLSNISGDYKRELMMIGVGPKQLIELGTSPTVFSGSHPMFDENTTEYSVLTGNGGDPTSEVKTFKINRKCTRYEDVQIVFMDKKGSFVPFTFDLVSRHNKTIQKEKYDKLYGSFNPTVGEWGYNTWDRGKTNLNTKVIDRYTVTSNWVDQKTSDYLMELFESPEVYWIKPGGTTVAINVIDNQIERRKTINDQIINYTMTFETSIKNNQQRG